MLIFYCVTVRGCGSFWPIRFSHHNNVVSFGFVVVFYSVFHWWPVTALPCTSNDVDLFPRNNCWSRHILHCSVFHLKPRVPADVIHIQWGTGSMGKRNMMSRSMKYTEMRTINKLTCNCKHNHIISPVSVWWGSAWHPLLQTYRSSGWLLRLQGVAQPRAWAPWTPTGWTYCCIF